MTREDRPSVYLPDEHRDAFRDPLGPIHTEVPALLDGAGRPVVAIGDMVAYHLTEADEIPEVAVIDGRTKREAVDPGVEERLATAPTAAIAAENPAGTITASLVDALREALARDPPVQVVVAGEEDLATVPAILLAPDGATVVYGQPDEGMVRVDVSPSARQQAETLFSLLDGDVERFEALLADGS